MRERIFFSSLVPSRVTDPGKERSARRSNGTARSRTPEEYGDDLITFYSARYDARTKGLRNITSYNARIEFYGQANSRKSLTRLDLVRYNARIYFLTRCPPQRHQE